MSLLFENVSEVFGINLLCSNLSNFNYKPQAESRQQHLALYVDCYLRSVAIRIEVTSRHIKCTYFDLDYSRMLALALRLIYMFSLTLFDVWTYFDDFY